MKIFLYISLFCSVSHLVSAQHIRNIKLDESANGKPLAAFLSEVARKQGVDFLYTPALINPLYLSGVAKGMYLNTYLDQYLHRHSLKLVKAAEQVYFIVPAASAGDFSRDRVRYIVLKKQGEGDQLLKGALQDADTREPLIGAQLIIKESGAGVVTDASGYFQLKVPASLHGLEIRSVGYETVPVLVGFSPLGQATELRLGILQAVMEMETLTITAEGTNANVEALVPGIQRIGIEEIKRLPTFLGEIDPVKSLTTLPGVSTVGELSSGFNVRGGETGQNLIVQDGAIIYNPTHLFGFFSAFNPDIISGVTLYKGGGPARFGGRVSSVLDIKLRNGDAAQHKVSGGVGLISSRLSLEGPLLKNRSSYLIGGRVSYSNWLLQATNNLQLMKSRAAFHDLTARVFHKINDRNYLSLSGYRSYDDFQLASDSLISWSTTNASLRWDHTFSERLASTLTLSNSNYRSSINSTDQVEAFAYENSIRNFRATYDLQLKQSEHGEYGFGLEAIQSRLQPGKLQPAHAESNVVAVSLDSQHILEAAVFLQGDFTLSDRWALSSGLRYSHFFRFGEDRLYTYDFSRIMGRYPAVVDTLHYGAGELIGQEGGFEPRLSLRYLINGGSSVKASYFRTYQYLHLISNTTSATPQDYWAASGPYLKPERGDQFSLGYFRNWAANRYELSLEGFYKHIAHAIDYIDGADISLNEHLEAGLVSGKGLSYGLELLARKNTGSLNGWVAYTYSRSLRQFKAEDRLMGVRQGSYYAAPFDQPHHLSLVMNYKLAPRTVLSGNFSYSTGRPITIPISKFSYEGYLAVLNYSERNEYRLPDYHRLDVSLTLEGNQRPNSRYRGDLVFSLFNLYGRKNAYSIYFNRYGTARKLSILGSVFPSISYNFSFK